MSGLGYWVVRLDPGPIPEDLQPALQSLLDTLTARLSPRSPHRYRWPELMRRVLGLNVLRCRKRRTHRRLVALITERAVILAILAYFGLV